MLLFAVSLSVCIVTEKESEDEAEEEEEEEIGDLDQLLRIERLKEQKRKDEEETIEPEEDEEQVISVKKSEGIISGYVKVGMNEFYIIILFISCRKIQTLTS